MSSSKRRCKYFISAAYLTLSAAVFFIGETSSRAQAANKPPVEPYNFSQDLPTLPPPPPETRTSPPKRTKPGAPVRPPLPPGRR